LPDFSANLNIRAVEEAIKILSQTQDSTSPLRVRKLEEPDLKREKVGPDAAKPEIKNDRISPINSQ